MKSKIVLILLALHSESYKDTRELSVSEQPISYPHVILLLHLKSLWPALLKQDLSLETGALILLAVTSNYHKHLGDHDFPQRTLFTLMHI